MLFYDYLLRYFDGVSVTLNSWKSKSNLKMAIPDSVLIIGSGVFGRM